MLVILTDQYCRSVEFWDGNLESGGEGKEVHIGQAYACINLKHLLLGYERKIAELSLFIFQK